MQMLVLEYLFLEKKNHLQDVKTSRNTWSICILNSCQTVDRAKQKTIQNNQVLTAFNLALIKFNPR